MNRDDRRQRIQAALQAYSCSRPDPTIRVLSAAAGDAVCTFCCAVSAVLIRWQHPNCDGDHVATVCACCASIGDAGGGRCGDLLDAEDRAALRGAA